MDLFKTLGECLRPDNTLEMGIGRTEREEILEEELNAELEEDEKDLEW
jgi:hypothetical protein